MFQKFLNVGWVVISLILIVSSCNPDDPKLLPYGKVFHFNQIKMINSNLFLIEENHAFRNIDRYEGSYKEVTDSFILGFIKLLFTDVEHIESFEFIQNDSLRVGFGITNTSLEYGNIPITIGSNNRINIQGNPDIYIEWDNVQEVIKICQETIFYIKYLGVLEKYITSDCVDRNPNTRMASLINLNSYSKSDSVGLYYSDVIFK
ncbi:MAG: hypothetical protein IPK88_01250 [Saprospiraceae bacterium]|nr:hypothetical protein [Candidatus Defluviibacterium haderslevense]